MSLFVAVLPLDFFDLMPKLFDLALELRIILLFEFFEFLLEPFQFLLVIGVAFLGEGDRGDQQAAYDSVAVKTPVVQPQLFAEESLFRPHVLRAEHLSVEIFQTAEFAHIQALLVFMFFGHNLCAAHDVITPR